MLQGTIDNKPAILLAERAAFPTDPSHLSTFPTSLSHIKNLGDNDVYRWYLACTAATPSQSSSTSPSEQQQQPADLKINLIYPCSDSHIKKYTSQALHSVTETPSIYTSHVRPYMQSKRDQGRLNWVFNILDGRTEQDDVLFRSPAGCTPADQRFVLLPDLNWDRETMGSLHLLALVERRDIWSLRDLDRGMVGWLRGMMARLGEVVEELYPGRVERDMLKFYVHCESFVYPLHYKGCFFGGLGGNADCGLQINLLTTTSTSTSSMLGSRPVLHKRWAKRSLSTT